MVLSTPTGFERLEIVPLQRRIDAFFADQDVSVYPKMMWVPKARIMEDIRFRGATGDFAALRGAIEACPLEEILFRANEEDVYGDATNLELALEPEAAERWVAIEEEMARRRRRDAVLAGLGEKEDKGPKKKKKKRKRKTRRDWLKEKAGPYVPQPWESAGSEAALEMMRVVPTRPRLMLRAERPRCLFNQPVELG